MMKRAQLVSSSPGTGKTRTLAAAVREPNVRARIVTGTRALAQETAAEYGYALVLGRNRDNCERYDVVKVLGERGYDVAALACGSKDRIPCPARERCLYWDQFQQEGPWAGTAEQLFNPHFLAGGNLVVVDDADLSRSLIERLSFTELELSDTFKLLKGKRRRGIRNLLIVLAAAILGVKAKGQYESAVGAAAWDALALAARTHGFDIVALVEALPKSPTLPEPEPNSEGLITASAAENAPPGGLKKLLQALRDEVPYFIAGEDFNSRLRISPYGIELWRLKDHVRGRHGQPLIEDMDLLVLDATPVAKLVDHLTRHHERMPDVRATVRLPDNVSVVQYAGSSNGHAVMRDTDRVKQVLAEIAAEREKVPTEEEGVVCFKAHAKVMVEHGFAPERVLTFGMARGTNALAHVERLHLVGRPMPPGDEVAYLARVLHAGEPAISDQVVLSPRPFGGQPYEVEVFDFADERVAAILRCHREDEVEQALHRARLLALEQPQLHLVGDDKPTGRKQVRLVLHTSHPVPGLRVDELVTTSEALDVNEERHHEALARLDAAAERIRGEGTPLTVSALVRAAGGSRTTATKYLKTRVHTPKKDLLPKGAYTLPQTPEPVSPIAPDLEARPRIDLASLGLCRGGCGKSMPPGQMCMACATRATEEWAERRKRRRPA